MSSVIVVSVIILIFVYLFYEKKKRAKPVCESSSINVSIVQKTLENLKSARAQISCQSYQEFSNILAQALREYIQTAYGISSFITTTEELTKYMLANEKNDLSLISNVTDVLRVIDSVKYSKRKLSIVQQRGLYKKACRFVLLSERFFRQAKDQKL